MTDVERDPGATDTEGLQFSKVEPAILNPAAASAVSCAICAQPITASYYALADRTLCASCRDRLLVGPSGSKLGRLLKASLLGLGAGLVGTAIWFAIRRFAQLEIGLVAILVGFMVGKAVRKGSGGFGGRGYQILAVLITYCCIAANYMPDVFQAMLADARRPDAAAAAAAGPPPTENEEAAQPVAQEGEAQQVADPEPMGFLRAVVMLAIITVAVFFFSLALPFLAGVENFIGLLIIGFALWEAWKFNARRELPLSGPYQIGAAPPA